MVTYAGVANKEFDGEAYKWCMLCGPGCSKGTPTGMYMKAPHKHNEWLAKKLAKQEKFKASKNKKQSQHDYKHKGTVAAGRGNEEKKLKLKLADSFVEGLTTHMSIPANDARKFVSNQLENFDTNTKSVTNRKSLN